MTQYTPTTHVTISLDQINYDDPEGPGCKKINMCWLISMNLQNE